MEGINVVSCFDGMGCLMIALKELGIRVNKYFAYEIDKFAIEQTKHNFPDIIHLGSITSASLSDFQGLKIDLIAGGSPCQGFSFAGKQLNFEDPRSKLFFDFVKLVNLIKSDNPNAYFLLENVNMKKEYLRVISEHMGVFPVNINAALVSAQNRERWFWTNIKTKKIGLFDEVYVDIPQPKDRGILLKDILESEVDEKYYIKSQSMLDFVTDEWRQNKKYTQINGEKGLTQQARQYSSWCGDYVCVASRGREACLTPKRTKYGKEIRKNYEAGKVKEQRKNIQQLEPRDDYKTNTLTSVSKDNLIMQINPSLESGGKQPYQQNRIYDSDGIVPALCANKADLIIAYKYKQDAPVSIDKEKFDCLRANAGGKLRGVGLDTGYRIRRLTPTECSRLQSVPSWYQWIVSDSQQYKMLGNGWNCEVIKHILSFMKL
jgi:DNA-cytosine methyltransferase